VEQRSLLVFADGDRMFLPRGEDVCSSQRSERTQRAKSSEESKLTAVEAEHRRRKRDCCREADGAEIARFAA